MHSDSQDEQVNPSRGRHAAQILDTKAENLKERAFML